MTPKERVIKERTVMDKLIAELSELIGQYGVQCSETKILAPTKELADAINRVVAALRQQGEPVAYPKRYYMPTEERAALDKMILAMTEKVYDKYIEGYGGFEHATEEWLNQLLYDHLPKGDPVDVANFCAFLYSNGQRITAPPTRDAALEEAAPEAPHPDYVQHIVFEGCDCVVLAPEDYEALYIRALRTGPANAQEQQVCEHGKGITDYCQPCGRINGGGNG